MGVVPMNPMENSAITRPNMSGREEVCKMLVVNEVNQVASTPTGNAITNHHQ
jgi:hypothetical protein